MDNNLNETDTNKYTLGPALQAAVYFVILVVVVGATAYVVNSLNKGEIAESEIEVRKSDNKAHMEAEEIHDRKVEIIKDEHAEKVYTDPWANMSLRELRDVKEY